jgi:hypothetical protein
MSTPVDFRWLTWLLVWTSVALAATLLVVVVIERTASALLQLRRKTLEQRYSPLVARALSGDDRAVHGLAGSPSRHRLLIARLLVLPLIDDRDPIRVARTRTIVEAMSLMAVVDRYLRSPLSWRRAVSLHLLGLVQATTHTAAIVIAFDDPHPDVRSAALDALTDLRDPSTLPALVVRLHDTTLPYGRRLSALTAFGRAAEPLLLDLMTVEPAHAINCLHALAVCGTDRSRPAVARLTEDGRPAVQAAAFDALGRIGLDHMAAGRALAALGHSDPRVRAAAARALGGWSAGETVARLADHLDDTWEVAVRAAQSLRSTGAAGRAVLEARCEEAGTAGQLARHMLWLESIRT